LNGRSNTIGHSRKSSSSTISRKSGPLEDQSDHRNSDSASSNISRKSGPSPKYDVKKDVNEKNDNNKSRFSSTTASKNDNDNQRSSTKKDTEIQYPPRIHRTSTTLSDEFFGDKHSSSGQKNKDSHGLSSTWFEANSKTDGGDNDETNVYSTPKTRSWVRDSDFDQDGT
jgi:hypothetical protein